MLHAYNVHRGGGGANRATEATIELSRQHGIEVEVVALRAPTGKQGLISKGKMAWGTLYGADSVRQFRDLLQRFEPEIVHLHEIFPMLSPWILPECTRQGIPVVMSCVDYRMTCPVVTHLSHGTVCQRCVGGREYNAILQNCRGNLAESMTMALYSQMVRGRRLFSDHVSHFVAPSRFARDWLMQNAGIPGDRISAISPVVELAPAQRDGAHGSYIGYAGRFSAEKGVGVMAEAARITGLPFRLARQKGSLVTLAPPDELDASETSTREELHRFYLEARAIVVPSIWFESFGLVAAEAMSYGIPVVLSRIGALEELIEDGVDGLLFRPGDAADLASKLTLLWNDADLARGIGRAARQKALRLWTSENHLRAMLDVYSRVTVRVGDYAEAGRG